MDQPVPPPHALFELLARRWTRPAPVGAIAFNNDQSAAAFAAADGSVAIVAMTDPEPPAKRVRVSTETGRATIRPRDKPARPATAIGPVDDRLPPLTAYRKGSFAVAGHDGRVLAVTARGQIVPFGARLSQRVVAIDHHAFTGQTACAGGGEIAVFTDDDNSRPLRLACGQVLAAVALSPDGRQLAAAHAGGVTVWRLEEPAQQRELAFAGAPTGVSWSPDSGWLVCPLAEGGFQLLRLEDGASRPVLGYPTPVRSVAWSRAGNALATGGAFRAVAWSMAHLPLGDATEGALQTGRPGLVVVERIAAHPQRDLVAAGYANGQVSIMQLGQRDELLLRQEDGGEAVQALAWSADGGHLAIGTADGVAAVASFPPHMFK